MTDLPDFENLKRAQLRLLNARHARDRTTEEFEAAVTDYLEAARAYSASLMAERVDEYGEPRVWGGVRKKI